MGYDLHITRKKNWDGFDDEHGPEIALKEWLAVVEADRELRLDGFCEVQTADGGVLRHTAPGIAVWTRWSQHGQAGEAAGGIAWFAFSGGNIVVKNPDRQIRRKMWRIARALEAKVQGDEGEFYDRFGNPVADAAETLGYWRARRRDLVFRFIWGNCVGGDNPPQVFARFPVVDCIYKTSPSGTPQVTGRRMLNIVVPKSSATPQQRAALEAARQRAKTLGIDLVITVE
ncbi:MAG TPA: hypothetical protein VMA30_14705 [Xanthobacteraceae bacterium]|nr:hypothetical protein [Xanthobacteraceae bacterium]